MFSVFVMGFGRVPDLGGVSTVGLAEHGVSRLEVLSLPREAIPSVRVASESSCAGTRYRRSVTREPLSAARGARQKEVQSAMICMLHLGRLASPMPVAPVYMGLGSSRALLTCTLWRIRS